MGYRHSCVIPIVRKRLSNGGFTNFAATLEDGPDLLISTHTHLRVTCLLDSFMVKQHLDRLRQGKEPGPMANIKTKGYLTNSRCAAVGANQCVPIISHEETPTVIGRYPLWI